MRILLACPVYNEAKHLAGVLAQARRHILDVLVVDDGSTDATSEILACLPGIRVIRHARNLGYGKGLIDSFDHAAASGYDWVITMDLDGQHDPEDIAVFLKAIDTNYCDIISGSRYFACRPDDDAPPADRRAINRQVTDMLNRELDLTLTDAFCGFKAHRVSALSKLRLTEPGYAFPLQFWVQTVRRGLRICEVPVRLIYNDPDRSFGGALDEPMNRRQHYMDVFDQAVVREGAATCQVCDQAKGCCG